MVPHTGCAEIRVIRTNLTRFTPHEPLWDAWCDLIRVLIRVLADRDLNRFADTACCHRTASPAGDGARALATWPATDGSPALAWTPTSRAAEFRWTTDRGISNCGEAPVVAVRSESDHGAAVTVIVPNIPASKWPSISQTRSYVPGCVGIR